MAIFNAKYLISKIDYRINLMRQRDELGNIKLINALMRERRALENKNDS